MHNFLIAQNEKLEKKTEEVDDSAVHNFRKKVEKIFHRIDQNQDSRL